MAEVIYIERGIANHPRTQVIRARFPRATSVMIDRYSEVFNRHQQNFRLQKQLPSLILAEKQNTLVQPTPAQHETGGGAHYYFSHMLNCVYDCRYCFLQGMFKSAHYLVFVNFESFAQRLQELAVQNRDNEKPTWFYSGYDCDSLAFEPMTGFAEYFIDAFSSMPNAVLELRTKSTQIRPLMKRKAAPNVVVAASLSPQAIVEQIENGTPSLSKRLNALADLQTKGWRIGLRFDPVIWCEDFARHYQELCAQIEQTLDINAIDTVTLGTFRVPKPFFKTMKSLYPNEPLFHFGLETQNGGVGYRSDIEQTCLDTVYAMCEQRFGAEKVFLNGVSEASTP